MQMVGYENSPGTMLITADMPVFFIGPSHGVGVGFMNDKIGLWNNMKVHLQYAYHQKMGKKKKARLSIGVRGALLQETFDGSGLDMEDSSDPAFATSEVKGTGFDLDAGLRFTYGKRWYVGMSAMHLLGPTVKLGDDKNHQIEIDPSYYLTAGYNFAFRSAPHVQIMTDAIVRTDLQMWRYDISARLGYTNEKLNMYAGVNVSPTTSVAVLLGGVFHGIKIGYSYEIYTSGIGALNGTHELIIGYETDLNMFKKGKNLHKSVRYL